MPPEISQQCSTAKGIIQTTIAAINQSKITKKKLVWLELTGCSGNIISLLNGTNPDVEFLITTMTDLVYSNSLMAAEGERAIQKLMDLVNSDEEFILAVEGAIATKNNGLFNIIGRWQGEPLTAVKAAKILGDKATHVIAVGACATHGGFSAAKPNPSGSVGLQTVIPDKKVIKLPGCPTHPDWFLGTLASLLMYGQIELDRQDRPLLFYSTTIHDRCPRRTYFNQGIFAKKLGEKTCLFKLGCRGPVTRTDCPTRQWDGYVNWPIGADTPCIGCAQFGCPDQMSPFISFDTTEES